MFSDFPEQDTDHITIPNEALRPDLSAEVIKELLPKKYGLTVTEIRPLNGYDDLNFHIKVTCGHSNPHLNYVSNDGYFLKVINLQDSRKPEFLDAQVQLMKHLLKKGLKCQTIIKGVSGEVYTELISENKKGEHVTHMVSLRSFIPGEVLLQFPLTPSLLFTLGQYVADVTTALQDFVHPFYKKFNCTWNLNTVPKLKDILFVIKNTTLRNMCETVVEKFQTEVMPLSCGFRKSQIHGDLNDQNILLRRTQMRSAVITDLSLLGDNIQICGLLDFEHSALSYPIYDLAISVCYMLMKPSEVSFLDIPGYILAGYKTKLDLTANEKAAFRTCVAARMVQSLVMGAYTHHLDPSNEYLLSSSKYGCQALTMFWSADKQQSEGRWDHIVETFQLRR